MGDLDNTYVIVFADHGEMLGEHGLYGHTLTLHNRVLHVPLLLAPPHDEIHQGVFSKRFRLQDLGELVLRLANDPSELQAYLEDYPEEQPIYAEYAGRQDRLTAEDRGFLAQSSHLTTMSSVLIDGRHKLVRSSRGADRLYDLLIDPDEEVGVAGVEPDVAQAMGKTLEDFRGRFQRAEGIERIPGDAAIEERLRALGYH